MSNGIKLYCSIQVWLTFIEIYFIDLLKNHWTEKQSIICVVQTQITWFNEIKNGIKFVLSTVI